MANEKTNTDPEKVSAEELPNTKAMQDEFTRSFLKSTKETEDGYYSFVSGTNQFEMYLPTDSVIGEQGYKQNEGYEQFRLGVKRESYEVGVTIEYISHLKKDNLDTNLSLLEGSMNKKLDFNKISKEGRDDYYASFNMDGNFGYAAYVQNTNDSGGILVFYLIECEDSSEKCENKDKEDEFLTWLKSIKFNEYNPKGDES